MTVNWRYNWVLTSLVIIISPRDTVEVGLNSAISLGYLLQYALSDCRGWGEGAETLETLYYILHYVHVH